MGLDVYVGSLTRYYSQEWETVMQKHAREKGIPFKVVRSNEPEEAITNPDEIRADVIDWRENLSRELGNYLSEPLDWNESPRSPYFTDKLGWDCYSSLLLWAAYSEHPDLVCPKDCIEDWTKDEAYQRSSDLEFDTRYPSLLSNTKIWLPVDFRFTFASSDLAGDTVNFGSTVALRKELNELNSHTWGADNSVVAVWRKEGADHLAPLEVGARFAFAVFFELAGAATEHKLIMKLDY